MIAGSGFVMVAVAAALSIDSHRSAPALLVALFVLAYALAARVEFEVATGSAVPTQLVLVPMLFLLPLGLVPACVAAGFLLADLPLYLRRHAHPQHATVAVVSCWHCVGPVVVLAAAGGHTPRLPDWPIYLLALASQFLFDFIASTSRSWFAFGVLPGSQLREMVSVWAVDSALAPIGLALAIEASQQRYAFLASLPLIGLIGVFSRERRTRIDNGLELSHAYRGTALLLGDMIEADDKATGAHSRDVVTLAKAAAERMGLDERTRRHAEFAALLHDIGKVRVPNEIINKPGPLTPTEWELIKQHTLWGEQMLNAVGGILAEVGTIVRSCHERWDGDGYPDGLTGEQIPVIARIIFACDTYSAMTTDRSYRIARPESEAVTELRRQAGSQFDPMVVNVLTEIIEQAQVVSEPIPLHPPPSSGTSPRPATTAPASQAQPPAARPPSGPTDHQHRTVLGSQPAKPYPASRPPTQRPLRPTHRPEPESET